MENKIISVLIVEDEPAHSEAIWRALEGSEIKFETRIVSGINEFRKEIAKQTPDIVLSDLNLPDGKAFEILSNPPEKLPYPILVMTAYGNEEIVSQVLKSGALDYIVKTAQRFIEIPHIILRSLREWSSIIEHRRAVESLKESNQFNMQIINSAQEGIIVYDLNMKYQVWNPFMEKLSGISASEVLGRHPLELFPFLKDAGVIEISNRALEGKIEHGIDFPFNVLSTGKNGWTSDTTAPLLNTKGEIIGAISTVRDITERKQAEENLLESNRKLEEALIQLKETQKQVLQQERMLSLGQLASGIAHDINNSLTPIMGYIDILTDDEELMKRNEKPLEMIIKSTKNIARTISRLKEFYKVKLTDEDLIEININKIINSTIELTKHKWKNIAESTGSVIDIKKDLQVDLPLTIADESEIIEALTNLVLNACDAMPSGGTLSFKTYEKENNIIIQITDTGFGMNETTLKRCIEPFFTTKGEQGTGLGLAMVYGVIDRHKGVINIESEPNKGTIICLVLPINKKLIEDKIIEVNLNLSNPLKILVVEDDISINDMLKNILKKKDHKVVQAHDGKFGLRLFKKSLDENELFDLVITDLGMPGLDGSSMSKVIKQLSPNIPIILLTGWGTLLNIKDYPTIDYLLKKPIMREDLYGAINELFKE